MGSLDEQLWYDRACDLVEHRDRLKRDLVGAVAAFERAEKANANWLPLAHLCTYELGYTHLYLGNLAGARSQWERMLRENKWSKAFYSYMAGGDHNLRLGFKWIPPLSRFRVFADNHTPR